MEAISQFFASAMDSVDGVVQLINSWLWDYALIFLLVGTGIFFTIRL